MNYFTYQVFILLRHSHQSFNQIISSLSIIFVAVNFLIEIKTEMKRWKNSTLRFKLYEKYLKR